MSRRHWTAWRGSTVTTLIVWATLLPGFPAAQEPADEQIRPFDRVVFRSTAGTVERLVGEITTESSDTVEIRTAVGTCLLYTSDAADE